MLPKPPLPRPRIRIAGSFRPPELAAKGPAKPNRPRIRIAGSFRPPEPTADRTVS